VIFKTLSNQKLSSFIKWQKQTDISAFILDVPNIWQNERLQLKMTTSAVE
jgi:hypothetical protein